MPSKNKFLQKTYNTKFTEIANDSFLGKIVSIDDPEKIGRVKINVYGLFGSESDKLEKISTDDIPFFYPLFPLNFGKNGSGYFSTPKMNQIVRVWFDGDIYHGRYWSVEHLDDDLKEVLKDSYENFHSVMFDSEEKLKFYYSKKSGIILDLDSSVLNIKPDNSILIQHKDSSSIIELKGDTITAKSNNAIDVTSNNQVTLNSNLVDVNGQQVQVGSNPLYSPILFEVFAIWSRTIATSIDAKFPLTSGVVSGMTEQMLETMNSKTITISP